MKLNMQFAKQAGIFVLFVLGFWLVAALYLSPAIGGDKVLRQGDMQQTRLMKAETDQYMAEHGTYPGWTDGMFSGMPSSLITGIPGGNLVHKSGVAEFFHLVRTPFNFLFVAMISMFVLLLSAGANRWIAAAGGIGYAFMTFSITSYEAGHITKVLAMDAMPGVLAGLILLSRKNYLWGATVLSLFFTVMVGYFHYQIVYYAGIIVAIYMVVEVVRNLILGEIKHALLLGGIAGAAMLAGIASNLGKIIDTQEYAKATMRGGSEVASDAPKKKDPNKQDGPMTSKKGLEIDYAFSWSYLPEENFTLLVPRFMGGSSNETIGPNELAADDAGLPLYHGDLQFTSGPVYVGAVFIGLFVFGIFVVLFLRKKSPEQYSMAFGIMLFSIIAVIISLILGMGRYASINTFIFENLPYYNKFRTPMMALTIAQVIIPFFGLYALNLLLNSNSEIDDLKKVIKRSAIAMGIVMAICALLIMTEDFQRAADQALKQYGFTDEAIRKLVDMRGPVAWKDWFRSLAFIAIAFGLIYLHLIKKQSRNLVYVGLLLLITIDMVSVSKRYLSDENWEYKDAEEAIVPSSVDEQLMKFNKNYARVYDLRENPFNDAHAAPWHRGIGGYHPAKLSRYQDMISHGITNNEGQPMYEQLMKNNALDMLNCAYILTRDPKTKKDGVIPRETALGNAWFVSKALHFPGAKEAIAAINVFHPKTEVIIEDKNEAKPSTNNWVVDSTAKIEISNYSLDTIVYKVNNPQNGFAVFSEVYYSEKNAGWKAFADGKEIPLMRVNYILRGAEIPANTKEVKMVYDKQVNRYLALEKVASGLVLLLLVASLAMALSAKEPKPADA